ncbi:RecQ family ATP-dependent DNA helicase [Bradyrhizobium sp.]|uniref:RecQ family ATP-dependent DNA helicase n=1 Tax=Bradyrhizobium sp. TaxID=376 RepID=UPI003C47263A
MDLVALLRGTFGYSGFRENQEAVCRSVAEGRDVLLVMPTGAGKSLCYQLPAVARGGTGLVVSPLIALMDDQAAKLTAKGLKVARIHSGLPREAAREACRAYLDGALQFLFIAPERLRVPGFPEMLARRRPSLIAVDEAHCISGWGHDFRPDYRTLGDYLPLLRPAPVIALTATATPIVQKDIVAQLKLADPALYIHGFRRENLAIEVVEMSKPERAEFVAAFLAVESRRPAIVYAPSRKSADALAEELNERFPTAAYHAGLQSGTRERVQRQFQVGELEVVVATIAFGMGIDKANIRTIMHAALPGSVEAYYQEIGRAGRDGKPSRAILLHSFADRRIHQSFFDRD